MLDNLATQEDAKILEEAVKREHRRRIDNFHINLTDNKFYEEKVTRLQKTKARAPAIREEAQRVEQEKLAMAEAARQQKEAYRRDLDQIAQQNQQKKLTEAQQHAESERMHRGLPIGERDRKRYDREIMGTLKNQINEKFNFRKKLDELSRSNNIDDILAYKQYLDQVEKQILEQNKKRRSANLKKMASQRSKARKNKGKVSKAAKITREKAAD